MSTLLEQPLGVIVDAPNHRASDLAEALTVRMAKLTFAVGAVAERGELLEALAAGSPAEFFRIFITLYAAHHPHDPAAVLRLKGQAELLSALEATGGLWRADEAQRQLGVGRATLQGWRRDRKVLALPLPDGSFGYPIAQFAPPASDLLPPRPYVAIEEMLRLVGDQLTAEEVFLLLATPQDALGDADEPTRTGFHCIAHGQGARVLALVRHLLDDDEASGEAIPAA